MRNYSLDRCHLWASSARKALDDVQFVQLWNKLDVQASLDVCVSYDTTLICEWNEMGPWERQSVFYMFIPEIAKIAKRRANAAVAFARESSEMPEV